MKKVLKIVLPIVIILIGILIFFFFSKETNTKDSPKTNAINSTEEAEEYIQKLSNVIIEGGTKKELVALIGTTEILDQDIMTGKDSYLRTIPSDSIIKENGLEEYVKLSSALADNLEAKIKENFSYNIESIDGDAGEYNIFLTYKTYYYFAYFMDLTGLQMAIINKTGIDLETEQDKNKIISTVYMAKIKAASIIDNYLDEYINSDETKTIYVQFKSGKISNSSENLKSYLINLNGYAYKNDELSNNSYARVKQYLTEVDDNNILGL